MADDRTTITITITLDQRIQALAEGRAKTLGLGPDKLKKPMYLEMLVSEEEKRVNEA